MAMVLSSLWPALTTAEMLPGVCLVPASEAQIEEPEIRLGVEKDRVWLESTIGGVRARKFTQKGGASVLELTHGKDTVVISVAPGRVSVVRNGTTRTLDPARPESVEAVHDLLASSKAISHARTAYSRLERRSALKAPQMSLLSSLAFTLALVGDVHAPERLGERFAALHGGRVRPVRLAGSCWTNYTSEATAAWDDYYNCLVEAAQGSVVWRELREIACELTWILRAESAWFEFLKCTGAPLAAG